MGRASAFYAFILENGWTKVGLKVSFRIYSILENFTIFVEYPFHIIIIIIIIIIVVVVVVVVVAAAVLLVLIDLLDVVIKKHVCFLFASCLIDKK